MSTQDITDMYRRRYRGRRRFTGTRKKVIQHTTSTMTQAQVTAAQHVIYIANAGTLGLTGTAATANVYATSNREQEFTVDSNLGKTTMDIGWSDILSDGIYEYVVWKRERQSATPIVGAGLPSNANATVSGLQQTYRIEMPGRVVRFGVIPLSAETPKTLKLTIDWKKFKMDKIKSGDWYGITFFNRTGATVTMDFQSRTKELI